MSRKDLLLVAALIVVSLVFGCKKNETPKNAAPPATPAGTAANPATASPNSSAGASPEKAFGLWDQGKQQEAAGELVRVDWSSPNLFSAGSPFLLSESQIVATAEPQRSQLINQALTAQKSVRALCRYVMDSSPTSIMDKKQYELSERQLQAVRQCGQALARPGNLLINRMIGMAIEKAALEKLSALYASNDRAKLPAIQTDLDRLTNELNQFKRR